MNISRSLLAFVLSFSFVSQQGFGDDWPVAEVNSR